MAQGLDKGFVFSFYLLGADSFALSRSLGIEHRELCSWMYDGIPEDRLDETLELLRVPRWEYDWLCSPEAVMQRA